MAAAVSGAVETVFLMSGCFISGAGAVRPVSGRLAEAVFEGVEEERVFVLSVAAGGCLTGKLEVAFTTSLGLF